jgi:hypothetical protein
MTTIQRTSKKFPRGYETTEVCFYLRRSHQELDKAGILNRMKKTFPNGRKNPLYDVEQVELLEINLIRRDGLVAFKVLQPDTPLIDAFEPGYSNELDCECPECGGSAIGDPRISADERAALIQKNAWPPLLWCFVDGFVEVNHKIGEKMPQHRLLGDALPEIK